MNRYLVVKYETMAVETAAIAMAVSVAISVAEVSGSSCKVLTSQRYCEAPVSKLATVIARVTFQAQGRGLLSAPVPFRMPALVMPRTSHGISMRKPKRGDMKEYANPPTPLMRSAELEEPMHNTPRVKTAANIAWVVWLRNEAKYETTTSRAAIVTDSENFAAVPTFGL